MADDANELKGILGQIKEYAQEIQDGFSGGRSALKSMVDVASQFHEYQKGTVKLNSDQLKQLAERAKLEKDNLERSAKALASEIALTGQVKERLETEIDLLQRKGRLTKKEQADLKQLIKDHDNINGKLKKEEELQQQVLSVLQDQNKQVDNLVKSLETAGTKAKFLEGLGKIDIPFLPKMLGPIEAIVKLLKYVYDTAVGLDKELGESSKNMNQTYQESIKSRDAMMDMVKSSKDIRDNATNIRTGFEGISKNLGLAGQFSKDMSKGFKEDVLTMGKLQATAGFTAEEVQAIHKFSLATGTSAKKNTEQFLAQAKITGIQKGLNINNKDLLKTIAKTTSAIQISIKGGAAGLADAAVKAKALGVDLNKVDDIAGSLINFEESLTSELEAELLVGKNINLEKARQAALDNDLATVAEEIAKQVGSSADFSKMNRIQQEAMAKAVGMNREELAKTLMEQEALKNLGAETIDQAKEKYDQMVKSGMSEAEIRKQIGNEELARQFEQMSNAEKKAEIEKQAMDVMANELMPILGQINEKMELFGSLIKSIKDNAWIIKGLFIGIGALIGAKMVKGIMDFAKGLKDGIKVARKLASALKVEAIMGAAKNASQTAAAAGPAAALVFPAILGALAGAIGTYFLMDDGAIPGGYGKRVLSTPKGSIHLNDQDTIVAMTDPYGKKKKPGSGASSGDNMAQTNALLQHLISVIQSGGDVTLDGQKVGKALKLGARKLE